MARYNYPCTGHIKMDGFGRYLEEECGESRRNLKLFAAELSERFSFPYITLTNSGSSANLAAALVLAEKVRAAGMPMTAVVSAFSFPTTIDALLMAGFKVTAVDVDYGEFNISFGKIREMFPVPSVAAVTHFLGFPCEIRAISEYMHSYGGFVLQDACETLGMEVSGDPIYTFGDITTLSFYHPHHMSSYGGGAVITINQEDYIMADSAVHWGRACKCHIDEQLCNVPKGPAHQFTYERIGANLEMSELNACFGRWQFRDYEVMEKIRLDYYQYLYALCSSNPNLRVWRAPDVKTSAFVFPVQMVNGWTIYDAYEVLSRKGIEIRTLMGGVCNEQAAFRKLLNQELLENAHKMAEETFFVGIHQTLTREQVRYVGEQLSILGQ